MQKMQSEIAGLETIGCSEILMAFHGSKIRWQVCAIAIALIATWGEAWADTASECQMLNWEGELAEALPVCREAAEQGNVYAQNFMGVSYANGEQVTADAVKSTRWFRKAADQDYAPAQTNLGMAYAIGFGIKQDAEPAKVWLQKAAEQGEVIARYSLGLSHEHGKREVAIKKFAAKMLYRTGVCQRDGEQTDQRKSCEALLQQLAGLNMLEITRK